MTHALALAILLATVDPVAHVDEGPTTGPLRFQEVVTVADATRDQIYSTALAWFSQAFGGPKGVVVENKLAGMVTGTGAERYLPPFMSTSCSGWLRYRVTLVARDGRYYYTIDGFTHEGDLFCNKKSFGLLTRDWLSARISRTIFDMTLQSARRDGDVDAWLDMKNKATTVAETLARSLRAKLATAAVRKPAA